MADKPKGAMGVRQCLSRVSALDHLRYLKHLFHEEKRKISGAYGNLSEYFVIILSSFVNRWNYLNDNIGQELPKIKYASMWSGHIIARKTNKGFIK